MEATAAVRHTGEVVIDVFSGARDADGDAVVGQKSGAGDEMPLGADRRSARRVRHGRVIRYRGGHGALLSTYRARAVVDAEGRSSIRRPEPGLANPTPHAADAQVSKANPWQTHGLARRTAGVTLSNIHALLLL